MYLTENSSDYESLTASYEEDTLCTIQTYVSNCNDIQVESMAAAIQRKDAMYYPDLCI